MHIWVLLLILSSQNTEKKIEAQYEKEMSIIIAEEVICSWKTGVSEENLMATFDLVTSLAKWKLLVKINKPEDDQNYRYLQIGELCKMAIYMYFNKFELYEALCI